MRLSPLSVVVASALAALLLWVVAAWAQPAWVLWLESPTGSDQWSVAAATPARFAVKEDCERRADLLNGFEVAVTRMQRTDGAALDLFTCRLLTRDRRLRCHEDADLHDHVPRADHALAAPGAGGVRVSPVAFADRPGVALVTQSYHETQDECWRQITKFTLVPREGPTVR